MEKHDVCHLDPLASSLFPNLLNCLDAVYRLFLVCYFGRWGRGLYAPHVLPYMVDDTKHQKILNI